MLLGALLFGLALAGAMVASFVLGGGLDGGPAALLAACAASALVPVVAAIALIDARYFIIPDGLNLAGLALGLVHAVASGGPASSLLGPVARGMALCAAFWALRIGYRAWRGRDGLGLGDVKLAGVAGVWLGVVAIPLAIEMAALSALLATGIGHLAGWAPARLDGRLPFGLFFAPAIWAAWAMDQAWGLELLAWGGL